MRLLNQNSKIIRYTIVSLIGIMLGVYIHLVTTLANQPKKSYEQATVIESLPTKIVPDSNITKTEELVLLDNNAPVYYKAFLDSLPLEKKENYLRLFSNSNFENNSCPKSEKDFTFFPEQTVNKTYGLADFVPSNLVNISSDIPSKYSDLCLDHLTALSLSQMIRQAQSEGIKITVTSAYRSINLQERFYKSWLETKKDSLIETSDVAIPGHSEHQLGTVIDLTTSEIKDSPYNPDFSKTKAYEWLKKNASKYGFYESYPLSDSNIISKTDYTNEPWHWRFLGR